MIPEEWAVTDEQIKKEFQGTNFGRTDYRQIMAECVLKRLTGYHDGGTITKICRDLGLLTFKRLNPTRKGKWFTLQHFYKR
jgi:hypothetical protein